MNKQSGTCGQALASGCALALCCDYRIQSEKGTLGLNEVALGIPVPKYWAKLFCEVAGRTKAGPHRVDSPHYLLIAHLERERRFRVYIKEAPDFRPGPRAHSAPVHRCRRRPARVSVAR